MAVVDGTLTPDEWLAISVVGREAKAVRGENEPGERPIDLLLRVKGTIKVGAPGTTSKTTRPKPEALLGFVLSILPPESLADVQAAIGEFNAGDEVPEVEEGFVVVARQAIKRFSSTETGLVKNGQTGGVFKVGLVDQAQLGQKVSTVVKESTRIVKFDEEEETDGKA